MPFSPRRVQALFLAVTLLFAGALGWLGWRLLQQDRALERQRRLEQLEAAQTACALRLSPHAEFEEALADPTHARLPPGDRHAGKKIRHRGAPTERPAVLPGCACRP
jgi:hypothetical protein